MINLLFSGGLGNQFFQYVAAKKLQNILNMPIEYSYISKTNSKHSERELNIFMLLKEKMEKKHGDDFFEEHKIRGTIYSIVNLMMRLMPRSLQKWASYMRWVILNKFGIYSQDGHYYYEFYKPFCFIKDVYITGLYHHPMYSIHNIDEIQKSISLEDNQYINNTIDRWRKDNKQIICVHVRRGDYLSATGFRVGTKKYYINAIDKIRKINNNCKFIFFSDDIKWCKDNFKGTDIYYMEDSNPDYVDFELMRNCDHFIISNSTYSWWSAYLCNNKNKIVITPREWFYTHSKNWLNLDGWIELDY